MTGANETVVVAPPSRYPARPPEVSGAGATPGDRGDDRALRRRFEGVCPEVDMWPLPGQGSTTTRFELLTQWASYDVVLGRLLEAHADAIAILYELGAEFDLLPTEGAGRRWAVWAAGPADGLEATREQGDWRLTGTKRWCSGATLVTDALVDAESPGGQRLFAVDLSQAGITAARSDWLGPGMRRADTRRMEFRGAQARAIGRPGEYLSRPGFWAGAIGVAACWHGGTAAVADTLRASVEETSQDPHAYVHLGSVFAALLENRSLLREAGRSIDERPTDRHVALAYAVRSRIVRNASEVAGRVGRALGPGPLAFDSDHVRAVHDLEVYIRQDHAERDLERLGRELVLGNVPWPT